MDGYEEEKFKVKLHACFWRVSDTSFAVCRKCQKMAGDLVKRRP